MKILKIILIALVVLIAFFLGADYLFSDTVAPIGSNGIH